MQRTYTILIGLVMCLFMVVSCDQGRNTEQQEQSKDQLESFVDSVETEVNKRANHNWTMLDRRFNALVANVETSYQGARDDAQEEWRDLEERYEDAKVEAKTKTARMEAEAERHMSNVESWWENNTARTQNAGNNTRDNLEGDAKDSWDWLEKNAENLGDNVRNRYRKIKTDLER